MYSRKSQKLNTLKSDVGVKNMIEDDKRIGIRERFNMWAKEVQDFSYKLISGTREAVDANIGVDSLKNIG